jgi:hypothetical protein
MQKFPAVFVDGFFVQAKRGQQGGGYSIMLNSEAKQIRRATDRARQIYQPGAGLS